MSRVVLFALALALLLLLLPGCYRLAGKAESLLHEAPASGREAVKRELQPPILIRKSSPTLGILTTGLSSLSHLFGGDPEAAIAEHLIRFELDDGTIVGGLLYPWEDGGRGPRPLLIASFGFLQDRFGGEAAKFHELYVERVDHDIEAHVLILDHPTSGTFLANNDTLSPGSYDDGRMWIEVASILRDQMALSSVHLFGVSMSGQTVVHALIEDARLGLDLFDSGLAISIAPNFAEAPGRQFAKIDTGDGVENPWLRVADPATGVGAGIQIHAMKLLLERQFVPGYRRVRRIDPDYELSTREVPILFWNGFEGRLGFLRRTDPPDWNSRFSRSGLPAFLGATRIAGVVDRVRTPLLMVSAEDDPAVLSPSFREVADAAAGNPWVLTYETDEGGHFGFDVPYGAGYLGELIELMMDPAVLANWNGPAD